MADNKTFEEGFAAGWKSCMKKIEDDEPSISSGTSCFLVRDRSFLKCEKAPIYKWLKDEGFTKWERGHGYYSNVDWIYINLSSKIYNPGMPGVGITQTVCDHAITLDEFMTIYDIYKKYDGESTLEF